MKSANLCLPLVFAVLAALAGCQSTSTIQHPSAEQAATTLLPAAAAQPDPAYAALSGHKAQAMSHTLKTNPAESAAPLTYTNNVANMPSPVAAAVQALAECERNRAGRDRPTSPCEIRRRNNILIHSTAELTHNLTTDRDAFIWRIEQKRKGTEPNVLYLAGSIHVLKPTLEAPPSYYAAFAQATTLVLEVDKQELTPEQTRQLVAHHGTLPPHTVRTDLFSAKELKQIDSYVAKLGIPTSTVANMKPAMLLLQAGMLEYIAMGYLPEYGVDRVFEAQRGSRALIGLETIEEQLSAATALPLALQAELLLETLARADDSSSDISALVHAWLTGDAVALNSAFNANTDSPAAQAWLDDLLAKRNIGMAENLLKQLNTAGPGETIFALVGAAHLVGSGSVIELLEAAGLQPQRQRHSSLQSPAS